MPLTTFQFVIEGTGAGDATWLTKGTVTTEREGDFPNALRAAQAACFEQLTRGDATYGQPGRGGCAGPYRILSFLVTRVG